MACQPCRRQPSPGGDQLASCPSPRAWPSPSSQVQAHGVASAVPPSAQTRLIPGVRPWYRGTLPHPKLLGPSVRTHPVRDAFQAPPDPDPDPDPDTDPGLMHLLHSSSIPAVSTDPTRQPPSLPWRCHRLTLRDPRGQAHQGRNGNGEPSQRQGYRAPGGGYKAETGLFRDLWTAVL